ncbi:MAG: glutamate-1-semialdehyde-2,1-aminomutase [Myxococcales bacterium]|nr:MAG: glutamate-1-semialdehyde-2,1-aminomutase [Myxococcales bacterium]
MRHLRSAALFERARRVIPGGVNSPVRAFGSVGGTPPFLVEGKGSRVRDADANEYVDYVGSWGPLILGHADPGVLDALRAAMERGTSFGAPTELEVELAELLCEALPGVERVRMVSSGTEAAMSALRLARAATGRERILKFEGCYHGHSDALLVGAGSGVATLGIPGSPGVPKAFTELTIQARYNDADAVDEAFARWGSELACVIVEPVAGNMGLVLPATGFLEQLRERCDRASALLVFDEVISGFRVGWSGAQGRSGVLPDLTVLGKIVGGGLPAAAYGGRADLMRRVAPEGPVYQAGTLSGNPLAMAAGLATLRRLQEPGSYERLEALSTRLAEGLRERAAKLGVELCTSAIGGIFGFFFHPGPVTCFDDARQQREDRFRAFFAAMLEAGIYLAPSPYECGFVSLAHTDVEIERTLDAAENALRIASTCED